MKQTQMIVKRNVSDSQKAEVRKDKVKMSKNWQRRRKNNILMLMLRCLRTRHGELKKLSGMQQMQRPNRRTLCLMRGKIEESLRPLCMVKDLNDDEVMELCILSNELNACETTAILNPSKFAPCATRLGLREGFAVDLTTARANGTFWDLSLEDDKAELRRAQNREQPDFCGKPIK